MSAKTRAITHASSVPAIGRSRLPKLMVAGCSYTWNNSEDHVCAWPYYLQNLLQFQQVFDCSQSGSGPGLITRSVTNEIMTNQDIMADDTMVILMWPDLARSDVIVASDALVQSYHHLSLYHYSPHYCNLSIPKYMAAQDHPVDQMSVSYNKVTGFDGQVYQNLLDMILLNDFLQGRGFHTLHLTWCSIDTAWFDRINIPKLVWQPCTAMLDPVLPLDDYADATRSRIPHDGHPDTECHLQWTRHHLIPYLSQRWPILVDIL